MRGMQSVHARSRGKGGRKMLGVWIDGRVLSVRHDLAPVKNVGYHRGGTL